MTTGAVSLYEGVRAYPADDFSVLFTGGSIGTVEGSTFASNLVIKAARLLARRAKFAGGVRHEL